MRGCLPLVLLLVPGGCRREEPPPAPAAIDAGAPVGVVAIPRPTAAVGDVVEWHREGTVTTRGRMYHKGRFRGNVTWTGTRRSTVRVETLAVTDGWPARLRLTYLTHATEVSVGGLRQAMGPAMQGLAYLADLSGGPLRVTAADGAEVRPQEAERVRLDVEQLELAWRPVQGRSVKIGESLGPLLVKAVKSDVVALAVKTQFNVAAGLGAAIEATVEGVALIDRKTGRLRELRDEGAASLAGSRVEGASNTEVAGSAEYVGTGVVTVAAAPAAEAQARPR